MTARDAARTVLASEAEAQVLVDCDAAETAGARWEWDPDYPDRVAGLVWPGTNRALVVVYVDEADFEVSEDLEGVSA